MEHHDGTGAPKVSTESLALPQSVAAELPPEVRFSSGLAELIASCGGIVALALCWGERGLQVYADAASCQCCGPMQFEPVLYVSGEESVTQVLLRAQRLQAVSPDCWLGRNK